MVEFLLAKERTGVRFPLAAQNSIFLVGVQGIEPCASRSQTEHSTDELHPGAGSGIRTRMNLRSRALKALAYTISPPRLSGR